MSGEMMIGAGFDASIDCWKRKEQMYIIFRNIIGELPFKEVKGLVELYSKFKDGVRLERPAHCSKEL